MENPLYSGLQEFWEESRLATRPSKRIGDKGSSGGGDVSFLDGLFMRHRPRWLPPEVRGDLAPGTPEVAETGEDALAEELIGLGLDELGRYVGRAVGRLKNLQGVMWDWDRPRDERFQAQAEHRAIFDVALDGAKRGQSALAEVAQGHRSVGEGLQELFEATDPLPMAQASEEVWKERRATEPDIWEPGEMPFDVPEAGPIPEPATLPREIPKIVIEYPPLEGLFFEPLREIGDPDQLAAEFLNSAEEQYLLSSTIAKEFAKQLKKESIVGEDVKDDDVENAVRHFLGAYTVTREFGSPRLTWTLGVLNEITLSRLDAWRRGLSKE